MDLVHYASVWVMPLGVLAAGLLAAAVQWGKRRGHLRLRGITLGVAALLASLGLAGGAGALLWAAIRGVDPSYRDMPRAVADLGGYRIAVAAIAVAAASWANHVVRRWASDAEIYAGTLVGLAGLTITSAAAMQGTSYLFVWPLLAGTLGLVALSGGWGTARLPFSLREPGAFSLWQSAALAAAAAAALLLLAPVPHTMFVALSLEAGGAVAVVVGLLTALISPQVGLIAGRRAALTPLVMVGLAAAMATATALSRPL